MSSPLLKRNRLAPAPAAEPFRRRGVLRSAEARLLAQPFEIEASWTPDLPLDAPPEALPESPPDPEPSPLDEAHAAWQAEADAALAEAVAAAREEAFAAGRAEGLAEGANAAEAEAEADRDADRSAFAEDAKRLRARWTDHLRRAEPLLVQLAIDTAEALLDAPLPDGLRALGEEALTAAVEQLAEEAPLTLTLHPADRLRLQEHGLAEHLDATFPGLRWTTDPSLAEGDWLVETPKAAVRRVRAELLGQLRDRLGLPDDADAELDDDA